MDKDLSISDCQLMFGDCLERMKEIPDGSIDMILCDPPFGTTACKCDNIIPFEPLWEQYKRIIKENGAIVLFGSQPFTSVLVMSNPKLFKYEWIWEKSKASNFLQASYMPLKAHENILIFSKGKTIYNPQKTQGKPYSGEKRAGIKGSITDVYNNVPNPTYRKGSPDGMRFPRSVIYFRTAESEGKFHPTQKSVNLLEYLINTYTNEGMLVLDNTMGSGSTGVACVNTNRKFIGIELDEKYYDISCKRIKDAINEKKQTLFK